jgi:hypothetical protein
VPVAADAHGDQSELEVAADEVLHHAEGEDGAGGADGVPQRDRAAVGIRALGVEAGVADAGDGLSGEGLVELDGVDVGRAEADLLEQRLQREDRGVAHDLRVQRGGGNRLQSDQAGRPAVTSDPLRGHHQGGGAVVDAGRVAGRDRPAVGEGRPQSRQRLQGGPRLGVLVDGDRRRAAPAGRHQHELLVEDRFGLDGGGPALRLGGELVLLGRAHVVAFGDPLRGQAMRTP